MGGDSGSVVGYAAIFVAILGFGSNFAPIKGLNTGDGVFFQFCMCNAVFVTSIPLLLFLGLNPPVHHGLAMLGGFIWCTGNIVCPLAIECIGMGLSLIIWGCASLLVGWAVGTFGLFGLLRTQYVSNPLFNYLGVVLSILGLCVFLQVKTATERLPSPPSRLASVGGGGAAGGSTEKDEVWPSHALGSGHVGAECKAATGEWRNCDNKFEVLKPGDRCEEWECREGLEEGLLGEEPGTPALHSATRARPHDLPGSNSSSIAQESTAANIDDIGGVVNPSYNPSYQLKRSVSTPSAAYMEVDHTRLAISANTGVYDKAGLGTWVGTGTGHRSVSVGVHRDAAASLAPLYWRRQRSPLQRLKAEMVIEEDIFAMVLANGAQILPSVANASRQHSRAHRHARSRCQQGRRGARGHVISIRPNFASREVGGLVGPVEMRDSGNDATAGRNEEEEEDAGCGVGGGGWIEAGASANGDMEWCAAPKVDVVEDGCSAASMWSRSTSSSGAAGAARGGAWGGGGGRVEWIHTWSATRRRWIGGSLALLNGGCVGLSFVPAQYAMDHKYGVGDRHADSLHFVFSQFLGILAASWLYTIVYCLYCRAISVKPFINASIILPATFSGLIWGVAMICWFLANGRLGFPITFPLVSAGPGYVGAAWGVLVFREIRGRQNLLTLLLAAGISVTALVLVALSR